MKSIRNRFNDLDNQISKLNLPQNEYNTFKSLIEYYGSTDKEENINNISKLLKSKLGTPQHECFRVFRVYSILDKQLNIKYLNTLIEDLTALGMRLYDFKTDLNTAICREVNLQNLYILGEVCFVHELSNELGIVDCKILMLIKDQICKVSNKTHHLKLACEYIDTKLSTVSKSEELLRLIFDTNKIKDINSLDSSLISSLKSLLLKKNYSGKLHIDQILKSKVIAVHNFIRKSPEFMKDGQYNPEDSKFNMLLFSNLTLEELASLESEFNTIKSFKIPNSPFLPISSLDVNRTDNQLIVNTQAFLKPLALELKDRQESLDYFTQQDFDSMLKQISDLQQSLQSCQKSIKIDANNLVISESDKLLCFRLDQVDSSQMEDLQVIRHQLLNLDNNYP